MNFFDIPQDIRHIIYKKAHFLYAKDVISKHLQNRQTPILEPEFNRWIVRLPINDSKAIYLSKITIREPDRDVVRVDTCDYSKLGVCFYVNEKDPAKPIRLIISREFSEIVIVYLEWNSQMKYNQISYSVWGRDRRCE